MLHSLVLDQTFLYKKLNNLQLNHVNTMQGKSLLCMQYYIYVLALLVPNSDSKTNQTKECNTFSKLFCPFLYIDNHYIHAYISHIDL